MGSKKFRRFASVFFVSTLITLSSSNIAAKSSPLSEGISLYNQGLYKEAEGKLMDALNGSHHPAEVFYYIGLVASKLENHNKAVGALKTAIKFNPNLSNVYTALGVNYYQLNLNGQALDAFNKAVQKNPLDSTAILFTGLIYQQSGKYSQAVKLFETVADIDSEYRQLALYNVGVSQIQLNEVASAKIALQAVININSDSDLSDNAKQLLTDLSQAPKNIVKPWSVSINAGFEYDSNVTISETDNTSSVDDFAGVFDASLAYKLIKTDLSEVEVAYDFYQSLYDDLPDFDIQAHIFSLSGSHEINDFDFGLNYSYNYTFLGADRFYDSHSVIPTLGFMPTSGWYVSLAYNFQNKNFFNDQERDSNLHAFSYDNYVFFNDNNSFVTMGYRVEHEDTVGSQFQYLGHYYTAGLNTKFSEHFLKPEAEIYYKYYLKDYDGVTDSILEEREDERQSVYVGLTLHFNEITNAKIAYEYVDAISNLSTSDFEEHIVTFTLGATF